ncbi:MAG: glycosyltransferase family 4 protein [Nitrospirota bacterium]
MKRLIVVSSLFPNREQPTKGIFNKHRVSHLLNHFDVKVISPLPWGLQRELPAKDTIDNIAVDYPRYFMIPKIGRSLYGFFYGLSLFPFMKRLFKQFSWDAMLVNWAYPDAFGMMIINRFFRRPLFIYVLGSDINIYTRFFLRRLLIVSALKKATKVFAVADQLRDKMVALGVDKDAIVVVQTGVDTDIFYPMDKTRCREQLGLPIEKKVVLFVGGLVPVKGLPFLMEAARLLIKKNKDLIFLMIGDGKDRKSLQRTIAQGQMEKAVFLLGGKPHSEIPLWMNTCDLFCLPSLSEGCPNVVMEALACGRPVVGTDVGDVSRLILKGTGGGYVVPPKNSQALSEAIDRALGQTWDSAQLSELILEYRWDRTAEKISTEIKKHLV